MCYDDFARPPLPPITGGAGIGNTQDLVLESGDGNKFAAYGATTAAKGGPGIVVLPDVRGLFAFYKELAERFAEAGVHAVAIDYFGRTAGVSERDADFDYPPEIAKTTPEGISLDTQAAVDHLRTDDGGAADAIFTVGFCFGGRNSFNQAARKHGLAGVIGFYGWPTRRDENDTNAPADQVDKFECPVLGMFGGADAHLKPEFAEQFREAMNGAGISNEIVVYDGAPHSFFDRTAEEHAEAAEDAWRRMLDFIRSNSPDSGEE